MDPATVRMILSAGDKAEVARLIAAVDILAIKFQPRAVPSFKRDQMRQKFSLPSLTASPFFVNVNAPSAIVGKARVFRIVASLNARGYSIEKAPTVFVVRNDVGVPPILFSGFPGFNESASHTPRGRSFDEVRVADGVRRRSTRAHDDNVLNPAHLALLDIGHGKFAEPVSSDWDRMLAFEMSSLAAFQEPFELTR